MNKAVTILWFAFVIAVALGAYAIVRLSSANSQLELAIDEQSTRIDDLSNSVERMAQMMRQMVTIGSLRAPDPVRAKDKGASGNDHDVADLEAQVDDLSNLILPYKELMEKQLHLKTLKEQARERMLEDTHIYSEKERKEIRKLYRRGEWESDEKRGALEGLIEKYPKSNRAGCATLYLGHMALGEEKATYCQQAIDNHGDCFYGDGVQVGAFARHMLAKYYEESGQPDKANQLRSDLENNYPDAIDHKGNPL